MAESQSHHSQGQRPWNLWAESFLAVSHIQWHIGVYGLQPKRNPTNSSRGVAPGYGGKGLRPNGCGKRLVPNQTVVESQGRRRPLSRRLRLGVKRLPVWPTGTLPRRVHLYTNIIGRLCQSFSAKKGAEKRSGQRSQTGRTSGPSRTPWATRQQWHPERCKASDSATYVPP